MSVIIKTSFLQVIVQLFPLLFLNVTCYRETEREGKGTEIHPSKQMRLFVHGGICRHFPEFRGLSQKNHEFKASLGSTIRSYLKKINILLSVAEHTFNPSMQEAE